MTRRHRPQYRSVERRPEHALRYLRSRTTVDPITRCWVWQGPVTPNGYGRTRIDGSMWNAHRYAYHHLVGWLHREMAVHHLCGNTRCVNPAHLQLASVTANTAEMLGRQTYEAQVHALEREVLDLQDALYDALSLVDRLTERLLAAEADYA
jgi:hypothetical protein